MASMATLSNDHGNEPKIVSRSEYYEFFVSQEICTDYRL